MLGETLSFNTDNYSGNAFHKIAIPQKMQRRIVVDLHECMLDTLNRDGFGDGNIERGYMVLGVFLHLIQDLQAHRARFLPHMVFTNGPFSSIYTEDVFTSSVSGTRINGNNLSGGIYSDIGIVLNTEKAIPMIDLKDYLKSSINIHCNGNDYNGLKPGQAYEDNPFFFSDRFTTAKNFSSRYMSEMNADTGETTTRTTYFTAASVPLI